MTQQPAGTHFDPENGFLLVKIDMEHYGFQPKPVQYRGQNFEPKDELHITVLSQEAAEAVAGYIARSPEAEKEMQALIDGTDWSFRKRGRFFHVRRQPGVESIIEMVELPALEGFFQEVSRWVGRALALPPAHVTLFVVGDKKGIGLPDQDTFDRLVTGPIVSI